MPNSRWKSASSDADFAPYLADKTPAAGELFGRFIALVRTCGPATFQLQPQRVVLSGTRRIFASVQVIHAGLNGHLNLARRLTDHRIGKVEPLTKRLYFHRFTITTMSDLDEDFTGWLCEARTIGDG